MGGGDGGGGSSSATSTTITSSESSVLDVGELIRKEVLLLVGDWDDEVMVNARFKAFSGQRSDWEHRYLFWRDLIINLSRRLGLFIIRPSQVKNVWFNRGGLVPLCLDRVLLEMYNSGDILYTSDLVDPTSQQGQLTQIFNKAKHLLKISTSSTPLPSSTDHLIVSTLLKEKADEVVKILSDSHWKSSCITTMRNFQQICGGSKAARPILSYLSKCGKAQYLAINKQDLVEGLKVSLSLRAVTSTTALDYDVLHLTWTAENLQQQLNIIDQHSDKSKMLALAFLKSGNKSTAMIHARKLKLASQSREKCLTLLNRVEEVLRVISDAEDSKKVFEALQMGAKVMKENNVVMEEVQLCLEELDESINSQKQAEKALGSASSFAGIEDELEELELEVGRESTQVPVSIIVADNSFAEPGLSETAETLSSALSNLKLAEKTTMPTILELTESTSLNFESS